MRTQLLTALVGMCLLGLAYALASWNGNRERARRRQALLDRLERFGKVTRW